MEKPRKTKHKELKLKTKLPEKLVFLPNQDKTWHETNHKDRSLLNFPHPYRICLSGKPNVGKSAIIQNIILRADPMFQRVVICHGDAAQTKEYNWLKDDNNKDNVTIIDYIPAQTDWAGDVKTLCIIDDLELSNLNKQQSQALSKLFGYVSTHRNVSVCCCVQDFFSIPCVVRRCVNIIVLWKSHDLTTMSQIAKKAGLTPEQLLGIFKKYCPEYRDSLTIDLTPNSRAMLRINCFQPIDIIKE